MGQRAEDSVGVKSMATTAVLNQKQRAQGVSFQATALVKQPTVFDRCQQIPR